jgi:hypothetical protein
MISNCRVMPILIFLAVTQFTCKSLKTAYEVSVKEAGAFDLAYILVKNKNFEYRVYFDKSNQKPAWRSLSHLNTINEEVLKFNTKIKDSVELADVCFVSNKNYTSPAMAKTRWIIQNQDSTKLSSLAKNEIYSLLPHEQVHALQQQFGVCQQLPRWFEEGQAVWIEYKVLSNIDPKKWNEQFLFLKKEYDNAVMNGDKIPVENWGGMGFSVEAIKRQLTPEGIKYLEKHGRTPPGVTLSFTPEDATIEHSIASHAANYYKSYLIFKAIESDIGTQELIIWNSEILEQCYNSNQIINSLKSKYGLDISEKLK